MYEVLFCFCILLHWRVFLPLVESSCQIWFPMLTFAFLSLPLLRKTDVKIRKQTEKRETKRKQETVFYVFLRVSLANIGKFKLSLKALILSAFTFICFLVFSNAFRRTKIFLTSYSVTAISITCQYPPLLGPIREILFSAFSLSRVRRIAFTVIPNSFANASMLI